MRSFPFLVIAIAALVVTSVGCANYVVLNVQDPQSLAGGAVKIAVGDDPSAMREVELGDVTLPTSITVTAGAGGEREMWVEALSAEGVVLARAFVVATISDRNLPQVVTLNVPCDGDDFAGDDDAVDARCDDGVYCNGNERCQARTCQAGPLPCPLSPFSCVDVVCLEEAGRCGIDVHHDRCPAADVPLVCDPGAGCVQGPACEADADCEDGFTCNGEELCADERCVPGEPPTSNDDNPCTLGGCTEEIGVVQVPANESEVCPLPGAPNDEGVCRSGLCGLSGVSVCTFDDDCADALVCNGVERCVGGQCISGVPLQVDDGNACTTDTCAEPDGAQHAVVVDFSPCPLSVGDDTEGVCIGTTCTSPDVLDPDALATPTNVTAVSGLEEIPLSWTAAEDTDEHQVQWRVGSGAFTQTAFFVGTQTDVTGVPLNAVVELQVRARRDGIVSPFSPSVTAVPRAFDQIAVGATHACGVTLAGDVYCWGDNGDGQLGDGTNADSDVPVQVPGLADVVLVAAGDRHSCAVTDAGAALCWGDNASGQLGDGSTNDALAPVTVGLVDVATIDGGAAHTCAVTNGGAAFCWGDNASGQLGDGSITPDPDPVAVATATGLTNVARIAAGALHSCAVTTGGAAFCWGDNSLGQLGDDTTTQRRSPAAVSTASGLSPVASIDAGVGHACAVTTAGAAFCWGDNGVGQLGDDTTTPSDAPVAVSGGASFASVAVGASHTCGRTTANAALCWGEHTDGRLGDDSGSEQHAPAAVVTTTGLATAATVAVGEATSCAITSTGISLCWGRGDAGERGDGNTTTARATPGALQ